MNIFPIGEYNSFCKDKHTYQGALDCYTKLEVTLSCKIWFLYVLDGVRSSFKILILETMYKRVYSHSYSDKDGI